MGPQLLTGLVASIVRQQCNLEAELYRTLQLLQ